jgi:hypothetical protein
MNYEPRQSILDLLDGLEAMHGERSSSVPLLKVVAAWHVALQDLSDEEVNRSIPVALRMKTFGWPKAFDVIEAARGRVVKIPEYARDLGGGRFRRSAGGPLEVARWHEIRIPLDWTGDAGTLDFEELPADLIAWNSRTTDFALVPDCGSYEVGSGGHVPGSESS